MAKRKSKQEKEIDNINNSVKGLLSQYKIIPKKEANKIVKNLEKENKKLAKKWSKTQEPILNWNIVSNNKTIKKIREQNERIHIQYGTVDLRVKASYLNKLKDVEKYLDGLYSRKMTKIIREYEAPKTQGQARELEGLITQYSKKISERPFYKNEVVQNSINKLTNYRRKLNKYEYSKQIEFLKNEEEKRIKKIQEIREKNSELSDEETEEMLRQMNNEWWSEDHSDGDRDGQETKTYKAVEEPQLTEGFLTGLKFNFF